MISLYIAFGKLPHLEIVGHQFPTQEQADQYIETAQKQMNVTIHYSRDALQAFVEKDVQRYFRNRLNPPCLTLEQQCQKDNNP
jgi:hypothetical protein